MSTEIHINFGNLLLAVSDAVELAFPQISSHQQRVAYFAWTLAKEMKLSDALCDKVFTAAVLHDVGAMTPEEKVSLHRFEETNAEPHCVLGEKLFKLTPFLSDSSQLIRYHHTPWENLSSVVDEQTALGAQILNLTDFVERLIDRDVYILHQCDSIVEKVQSIAGKEVHRDIVDAFFALAKREAFWLDAVCRRLHTKLLQEGPYNELTITLQGLRDMGALFRSVIDFRSRFTSTHSAGVSASAVTLARLLKLSDPEVEMMAVAGDFHDIGKMVVPNAILEKPGSLTREEFAVMRQHTYYTYVIMQHIGGLGPMCEWAAYHHEKLNGSGYPFHVGEEGMDMGSRIMAVADIFTALSEDRPYRPSMEQDRIVAILTDLASKHLLDRSVVEVLLDNFAAIRQYACNEQYLAKEFYEHEFAHI